MTLVAVVRHTVLPCRVPSIDGSVSYSHRVACGPQQSLLADGSKNLDFNLVRDCASASGMLVFTLEICILLQICMQGSFQIVIQQRNSACLTDMQIFWLYNILCTDLVDALLLKSARTSR